MNVGGSKILPEKRQRAMLKERPLRFVAGHTKLGSNQGKLVF